MELPQYSQVTLGYCEGMMDLNLCKYLGSCHMLICRVTKTAEEEESSQLLIYHLYNHRRVKIITQFTMVQHEIQCTYHLFKFNNDLGFCSYSIMAHVVFMIYEGLCSRFHVDRMVGMQLFTTS